MARLVDGDEHIKIYNLVIENGNEQIGVEHCHERRRMEGWRADGG